MRTFIRLTHSRFLLVVEPGTSQAEVRGLPVEFHAMWPEASLLVVAADEYHDASGEPIDIIRPSDLRGN